MQQKQLVNSITVITPNYPLRAFPERGVFVETLVRQWCATGLKVDVVAPVSFANIARGIGRKKHNVNPSGNKIVSPKYISASNKQYGPIDLKSYSKKNFLRAALKGVNSVAVPDVYYGKFLLSGGFAAMLAGKKHNRPSFADMGESVFLDNIDRKDKSLAQKILAGLSGIICVSDRLRDEIITLGADESKILVIPNEADTARFHPMDKLACRQRLGIDQDFFIVAFTGHFIERKGPLRVLKAIELLNDSNVYGVFFGQGPQKPAGKCVLHAGPVPNEELPIWLNASDVFVLPTLAEGSCNAINEAIACGLPVITSDIKDMDVYNSECSLFKVNPTNIEHITATMRNIKGSKIFIEKSFSGVIFKKNRHESIFSWINKIAV